MNSSTLQLPKTASTATFQTALWILCALIIGQFVAIGWALFGSGEKGRFALSTAPSGEFAPDAPHQPTVSSPGTNPASPTEQPEPTPSLPLPPENPVTPLPPPPAATIRTVPSIAQRPDEPYRIVPASARIRDPEILTALRSSVDMRKKGDTHGALMTLKELDMLMPNNPRIMHEIAVTYDLMQLRDKANTFWERVYAMGESGAGDYYALADMQLNTKEIDGELIPDGQYVLNVGDIVAKRDPSGVGERIYIRVPINSLPNTAVDPSKVTVNIQFFDLIDGNRIEKTTNRTDIRWRWTSVPIDWKEQAPENWDVTYFRDDSAPEIEPISGGRRYYGYIVRLYYNNELQDVIANPRTLIDFRPEKVEEGPPILDNSLFPSR